jgi:hypothetical protein
MSGLGQQVAGPAGRQALHLKRAQRMEADRWSAATRGTMWGWLVELEACFRAVRPEMVWNFDEPMVTASRAEGGRRR